MSKKKKNTKAAETKNVMDVNGDGIVDAKDVAEVSAAAAKESNTSSVKKKLDDEVEVKKGLKIKKSVIANRRRG